MTHTMELPESKLPHVGTTIFSVMSAMAQQHGAINLGQGFPGFGIDSRLVDEVSQAMREGHNQYAPMPGMPMLTELIAEKIFLCHGHRYHAPSEVTITAGATQALYSVFAAFINPGDEVILFAPAYDSYAPAISVHGGVPVWIRLREPDYQIDWDEVASRITPKTRMVVINSPNNPTGSVLSDADMLRLQDLLTGTQIILLSDEVYEHLVFDGRQHASAIRYADLVHRTCVVFSFGKTFHATGWKMGYVCAP
ncbi:MAG: aminotransferase class I/II-fold pyridoxal phosphate-dependent enzyme, partial [Flavobacteriales bacterium]